MTRLETGVLCALCLVFGLAIGYAWGQHSSGLQKDPVTTSSVPPKPQAELRYVHWQPEEIDYSQNYGDGDGQAFQVDVVLIGADPCIPPLPAEVKPQDREIECPSELDDNGNVKPKPISAYHEYH